MIPQRLHQKNWEWMHNSLLNFNLSVPIGRSITRICLDFCWNANKAVCCFSKEIWETFQPIKSGEMHFLSSKTVGKLKIFWCCWELINSHIYYRKWRVKKKLCMAYQTHTTDNVHSHTVLKNWYIFSLPMMWFILTCGEKLIHQSCTVYILYYKIFNFFFLCDATDYDPTGAISHVADAGAN
jgi:hypothetical protein